MKQSTISLISIFAIGVVMFNLPAPEGLSLEAWHLFAIYITAILGIIFRPLPEPVMILGVIGVSGFFVNLKILLSGYASTTVWLVFSAFMISQAFIQTGLGKRIAYILIGKFGKTSLGIGYVMALTDYIISPATPSNTARSGGIIYPIFKSLSSTLGSEPGESSKKLGGYLTLLMYHVSLTTAVLFLTAMAPNLLVANFAKDILHVDLSWMTWATAAFVPGMIILLSIPYIIYKLYPPEIKTIEGSENISKEGLKKLGPVTWQEKILMVLFIVAIALWATGNITKISSTTVALAFLSVSLLTGIISWNGILEEKGGWNTLIWYGGIIGLATNLAKAGFFKWLATLIQVNINFTGFSDLTIYICLVVVSLIVRYLFASTAAYVTTMIPVLYTIGFAANVSPMPLALLIAFAAGFGSLITHYGGAVGPVLFGTGYVDQKTWWKIGAIMAGYNLLIYLVIGMPYWKLLGLY